MKPGFMSAIVLTAWLLASNVSSLALQAEVHLKPIIVSVAHPTDSQGETVYERQSQDTLAAPAVSGLYVNPRVLRSPPPEFSNALRQEHFEGEVTVTFVVSAKGQPIDFETNPTENKEAISSALAAVRKYRFAPSTLDGKPVATRIHIVVSFAFK